MKKNRQYTEQEKYEAMSAVYECGLVCAPIIDQLIAMCKEGLKNGTAISAAIGEADGFQILIRVETDKRAFIGERDTLETISGGNIDLSKKVVN